MSEMPNPGKDHGQPPLVGSRNKLIIAHGAPWLNNGCGPGIGHDIKPIPKGEKGIGGQHRALKA